VSGIRYTPADRTGHTAWPEGGTYVRENDGEHVGLLNGADYPIAAECKICHGLIRLDHLMQLEWRHVPVSAAEPAGGAA
jgi:hypothetical protein